MFRALLAHRLYVAAASALLGSLLIWPTIEPAAAHGSTQHPGSRVYACRFDQPTNQMCAEAWAVNAQALYDSMEVNRSAPIDNQAEAAAEQPTSASQALPAHRLSREQSMVDLHESLRPTGAVPPLPVSELAARAAIRRKRRRAATAGLVVAIVGGAALAVSSIPGPRTNTATVADGVATTVVEENAPTTTAVAPLDGR